MQKSRPYTYRCYLCASASQKFLCPQCEQQIPWVQNEQAARFCLRCGAEMFCANKSASYCNSCSEVIDRRQNQPDFYPTSNYPIAYYQGVFAQLLQWYKFAKELQLGNYFTMLLQNAYFAQFADYFIVPVPPRAQKLQQEAWDQVGYMCRKPLPILRLLQRNVTIQQKHLGRAQRLDQSHANHTYSLALSARRLAWKSYRQNGPLRLLLLDDVYTTGATMDMCRHALRPLEQQGWVAEVRSLSLCLVL